MQRIADISIIVVAALFGAVLIQQSINGPATGPFDGAVMNHEPVREASRLAGADASTDAEPEDERTVKPVARKDVADRALPQLSGHAAEPTWQAELQRSRRQSDQMLPARLPEEFIEDVLEVAADVDAGLAVKLEKLRAADPERFEQELRNMRRLIGLVQVRREDPKLYEWKITELQVESKVSRLVAKYRYAYTHDEQDDMARIWEELRATVSVQLALGIQAREEYLCKIQDLVDKELKELEQQRERFDELVEERIQHLVEKPPT
jgi:hypothetical protein